MFSLSRAIAALGFLSVLCSVGAQALPAFDPTPYLHPQQLINVGNHRMNLYCTGRGSPTVILGTDGDDPTSAWRFVQPLVAHTTRVCSYDPPGFGFSTPITTDLDANSAVNDMHTLLSHAGITGRIVIVGYAVSGLYARLYADRYPQEVAGMVLVSPEIPNQDHQFERIAPALAPMLSVDLFLDKCLAAARAGAIRQGNPAYLQCVYSPPDPTLPKALLDRVHSQWQGIGLWSSFISAMKASDRSSSEVLREQHSYGDIPFIVLTTIKDISMLPIPPKQKAALTHAWISWHQQIAKLSSRGMDFVVQDSTQAIPIERPADVVSAIDEVVNQVRYQH